MKEKIIYALVFVISGGIAATLNMNIELFAITYFGLTIIFNQIDLRDK